LELGKLLDRQPAELSGGQRQRVAMGRAIVRNPSVFLFDEPLSNLDAKLRTQMRTEIKRLHARLKNTVIYVTHDQLEAMTLADRIVVMRGGVIEQIGTPAELFNAPASAFVAGFIGSPPMNLMPCKLTLNEGAPFVSVGENARLKLKASVIAPTVAESGFLFGVRPEDIYLEARETTQPIQGHVELVEPLGAESLVHVRIDKDLIIVRVEGRRVVRPDEVITLHIDVQRVYLFDAASDQCVYRDTEVLA
jgi:multiple sugar transport system ATP-binding protein